MQREKEKYTILNFLSFFFIKAVRGIRNDRKYEWSGYPLCILRFEYFWESWEEKDDKVNNTVAVAP